MARQVILFSAHPVRVKQAPVHQTAILVDETAKNSTPSTKQPFWWMRPQKTALRPPNSHSGG